MKSQLAARAQALWDDRSAGGGQAAYIVRRALVYSKRDLVRIVKDTRMDMQLILSEETKYIVNET